MLLKVGGNQQLVLLPLFNFTSISTVAASSSYIIFIMVVAACSVLLSTYFHNSSVCFFIYFVWIFYFVDNVSFHA